MPTVVLKSGATVFVTGVNGLIGSHIADQLLQRGYNVRGAVRDVGKNAWLAEYFLGRHENVTFELVEVPDMTVEGCYNGVVTGIDGFIHVASPLGGFSDATTAIPIGIKSAVNALDACAKSRSVKRFVFTSSSVAASLAKPNVEYVLNENSYNEEAIETVEKDPTIKGLHIYAALKTEAEKAVWKWTKENKPTFVVNTILPNANFGRVLIPEHQGFPSTIDWARAAWTGEHLEAYAKGVKPQWFISPVDTALLHISALIHGEVESERLFGYAGRFTYNEILGIYRKLYPERAFHEYLKDEGVDMMNVPNGRAEDVLKWVKGSGWDCLEQSLREMSEEWSD